MMDKTGLGKGNRQLVRTSCRFPFPKPVLSIMEEFFAQGNSQYLKLYNLRLYLLSSVVLHKIKRGGVGCDTPT